MMQKDIYTILDIAALIHKGRKGELSAQEEIILKAWIGDSKSNEALYKELMKYDYITDYVENAASPGVKNAVDKVYKSIGIKTEAPVRSIHYIRTTWFRAAAAIVLLLAGVGSYFILQPKAQPKPLAVSTPIVPEILPGKTGAVLTLADGTQVVLDSLQNGFISLQNGSKVLLDNGRLIYTDDSGSALAGPQAYNIMTTPKGRQFHLLLEDGTHVWLNSASSISYPTKFKGKERRVEIKGEAYFEVAKNTAMPFKISVNNKADIEVLGTSFNINAYENEEDIKATLIDGSIRTSISLGGIAIASSILKPGQQAQITKKIKIVPQADINKVTAWKSGIFNFEGVELRDMMRQLERWYDISVIYEKGVPKIHFIGELSRDINLSDLLIGLKGSGLHFRIEGRNLVLMP